MFKEEDLSFKEKKQLNCVTVPQWSSIVLLSEEDPLEGNLGTRFVCWIKRDWAGSFFISPVELNWIELDSLNCHGSNWNAGVFVFLFLHCFWCLFIKFFRERLFYFDGLVFIIHVFIVIVWTSVLKCASKCECFWVNWVQGATRS